MTALGNEVLALRRERAELARGKAALQGELHPPGAAAWGAGPPHRHPAQAAHPGGPPALWATPGRIGWGLGCAGDPPLSPSSRRGAGAGQGEGAGAAAAAGGCGGAAASAAGARGAMRGPAERARSHPVRSLCVAPPPPPPWAEHPRAPTLPNQPSPTPSPLHHPALSLSAHGGTFRPPIPSWGRGHPLTPLRSPPRRDYAAEVDALRRRRARDRATGRRCPLSRYFLWVLAYLQGLGRGGTHTTQALVWGGGFAGAAGLGAPGHFSQQVPSSPVSPGEQDPGAVWGLTPCSLLFCRKG